MDNESAQGIFSCIMEDVTSLTFMIEGIHMTVHDFTSFHAYQ